VVEPLELWASRLCLRRLRPEDATAILLTTSFFAAESRRRRTGKAVTGSGVCSSRAEAEVAAQFPRSVEEAEIGPDVRWSNVERTAVQHTD
jgi:hypothetical protein